MRVTQIIHSLAPGGAESLLVDLARVAATADLRLAVLSLVPASDDRHVRALRELGVPVRCLDLPSRWDPRAFRRSIDGLRGWRPQVIHTHLKHADVVGAVASRVLGTPMVSTSHVIEDDAGALLRAKRGLAGTARRFGAQRVITLSQTQRTWYLRTFPAVPPDRVVTIHNGVADPWTTDRRPADREAMRRSIGVPPAAVFALQIGMLRPGKGHACLFTALRRLPPASPLFTVVAGAGPLRARLETAAGDLAHRVRFVGYRDDIPALLDACDLVVHPSEFDAFPSALLQALAAGRPVIATAVGGIPEIVAAGQGVLVPPGDPGALARALDELAADPLRRSRLGAGARQRFEASFDARIWAARLRSLYEEVSTGPCRVR